jgi:hypothetical protein
LSTRVWPLAVNDAPCDRVRGVTNDDRYRVGPRFSEEQSAYDKNDVDVGHVERCSHGRILDARARGNDPRHDDVRVEVLEQYVRRRGVDSDDASVRGGRLS